MGAHRVKWMGWLVPALLVLAAGCTSYPTKFGVLHGGHIAREHAKPMEGGYYQDFDPEAASVEVTPVEDTNPVRTQHVLIATVKDADGKPLKHRRVEWIINEGSVGSIVELDESGWYDTRGYKVDNKYAVSHTNRDSHVLTRGNDNPDDDIRLEPGQTWCVITSPIEGDTHVTVYAPAIFNWDKHKVFAVKHWLDAAWQFPPDATNPVGTTHELAVRVTKNSDGTPYEGWDVHFKITGGPDAVLVPGNKPTAVVKTDAQGVAKVTLKQAQPVEGANTVAMEIIRPANVQCCKPAMRVASGTMTKRWVGPRIAIRKTATAKAGVGDAIAYRLVVTNPGKAPATKVQVADVLPDGIEYVSSDPEAKRSGQQLSWSLGTLDAGGSRSLAVHAKATRTGRFENCADVAADHGLKARDCAETVVTAPSLAVEKTGPAEVLICEPITYNVLVRNTGDGPATGVRLEDKLPAGLKTQNGNGSISADLGSLNPGEAKRVSYTVSAEKAGTFTNTAMVTAERGLKAQATHKIAVRQPVLVVSKKGPALRYVNRNATYEIKVSNTGDGEARGTVLTDTLPAGMKFVSADAGGRQAGGKVTWNLGTIAPKQSKTVSVTLTASQLGAMRNVATATAKCAEASADMTTNVTGIAAILLETVDLEDPIEVGSNETYVITVTNQGSAVGTKILVACTLPAELDYVTSQGPTQASVKGKKVTFAPLAELAPHAKAVYRVVVKGTKAGDVRFGVELKSDQMQTPANETESTHIYE